MVDHPGQDSRGWSSWRSTVRAKMVELRETVSAAQSGRLTEAMALVKSGKGKGLMDAARGGARRHARPRERRLLGEREAVSQAAFFRLLLGLYGGRCPAPAPHRGRGDAHPSRLHAAEGRSRRSSSGCVDYQQKLIGMTSHDLAQSADGHLDVLGPAAAGTASLAETRAPTPPSASRGPPRGPRAVASTLADYTHARLGSGVPIDPRPARLGDVVERVTDELRCGRPRGAHRAGQLRRAERHLRPRPDSPRRCPTWSPTPSSTATPTDRCGW